MASMQGRAGPPPSSNTGSAAELILLKKRFDKASPAEVVEVLNSCARLRTKFIALPGRLLYRRLSRVSASRLRLGQAVTTVRWGPDH